MNILKNLCLFVFFLAVQMAPVCASEYDNLDQRVLQLDHHHFASISELSQSLANLGWTDKEKARALFVWLAHNIAFNVKILENPTWYQKNLDPEFVFKSREAVCSGYARLFVRIAKEMGLEAEIVTGYARGGAGSVLFDSGNAHDWNAIRLDEQWYLLDTTWAAEYWVSSKREFRHRFNPEYFLTRPERMILSHFPLEARWQLLAHPLSREQYQQLPDIGAAFLDYGLQIIGYANFTISLQHGLVQIPIAAHAGTHFRAQVIDFNRHLLEGHTLVQQHGSQKQIQVVLPQAGEYRLNIYVGDQEATAQNLALSYKLVSLQPQPNQLVFPGSFPAFGEHGVELLSPMTGRLIRNRQYRFELKVPGADRVAILSDDGMHPLQEGPDRFSGSLLVKGSRVRVVALFSSSQDYQNLLDYQVSVN